MYDPLRQRWFLLTPEEHVRQLLIQHLIKKAGFPAALMASEKAVKIGTVTRRFDLLVFNRQHQPWLLAECKEPGVAVTEATLYQLLAYHSQLGCRYWLLTNGLQTFCADAGDPQNIQWLKELPVYEL